MSPPPTCNFILNFVDKQSINLLHLLHLYTSCLYAIEISCSCVDFFFSPYTAHSCLKAAKSSRACFVNDIFVNTITEIKVWNLYSVYMIILPVRVLKRDVLCRWSFFFWCLCKLRRSSANIDCFFKQLSASLWSCHVLSVTSKILGVAHRFLLMTI